MILVNFSHPLTLEQIECVARLAGRGVERVIEVKTQLDPTRPFVSQMWALVDSAGLTPQQWQTEPLLVNPPSLSVIACLVLAEIHGRAGYFPPVLRMRPVKDAVPPRFEVAEVLDLHAVREAARARR